MVNFPREPSLLYTFRDLVVEILVCSHRQNKNTGRYFLGSVKIFWFRSQTSPRSNDKKPEVGDEDGMQFTTEISRGRVDTKAKIRKLEIISIGVLKTAGELEYFLEQQLAGGL